MLVQALEYTGATFVRLCEKLGDDSTFKKSVHRVLTPQSWIRYYFAWRFLRGDGIEIGALHKPLKMPPWATARYVDRMSLEDLREHYPELRELPLVRPDIVDNGETLASISSESLDFIVANHFLEHCEDPIGTIRNHLTKLKPGGTLFLALPVRDFTFDRDRPLTSVAHLVRDYTDGPEGSRRDHYAEWVSLVDKVPEGPLRDEKREKLLRENYSIHYHVWSTDSFRELLGELREELSFPFSVSAFAHWRFNPIEMVWVLRRTDGEVPARPLLGAAA